MKTWRRCFEVLSLLTVALAVSACGLPKNIRVANDYAFPAVEDDGIVFFSASVSGYGGDEMYLYMRHDNKEIDGNSVFGLQEIKPLFLSKRKTGSWGLRPDLFRGVVKGSDDVVVVKLPVGGYEIWRWALWDGRTTLSPVQFQERYAFSVSKNKATYIGHLNLSIQENSQRYAFGVSDNFDADKIYLKAYAVRIKDEEIEKAIMTRSAP